MFIGSQCVSLTFKLNRLPQHSIRYVPHLDGSSIVRMGPVNKHKVKVYITHFQTQQTAPALHQVCAPPGWLKHSMHGSCKQMSCSGGGYSRKHTGIRIQLKHLLSPLRLTSQYLVVEVILNHKQEHGQNDNVCTSDLHFIEN